MSVPVRNDDILKISGYEMRRDTFNWFLAYESYEPQELPVQASPLAHLGLITRDVQTQKWVRTTTGRRVFREVFQR